MEDENKTMSDKDGLESVEDTEDDVEDTEDAQEGPTTGRRKKPTVAKSEIDGTMVKFRFTDNSEVVCDVSKLPPEVQFRYALDGVRNAGRLAFQKMTEPDKARAAVTNRFERMARGESTKTDRTNDVVDDLTQALANVTGKPVSHIESVFYPKYFASAESGCTTNTDRRGKVRVYGKKEALAKLRLNPKVRAELDKIVKARAGATGKNVGPELDLNSLAA